MGRLTTACNLLKFKMIFRSPMGMPFACSTAVTNRCNLSIMCLYYDLLCMKLPFVASTLTLSFHEKNKPSNTASYFYPQKNRLEKRNTFFTEIICITWAQNSDFYGFINAHISSKAALTAEFELLTNTLNEKPETIVLIRPSKAAWVQLMQSSNVLLLY